jgi:hypothetical protein
MKETNPMLAFLYGLFLLLATVSTAAAQVPAAAPVTEVKAEALGPENISGLVVLELFSSQACIFCPKAEQLLGDLVQNQNVIGLSCHVDYFDVDKNSLAMPFCGERQNAYERKLRSGPNYTPQVIVNGRYDTVGYRLKDISAVVRKARKNDPQRIEIKKGEGETYDISFPAIEGVENFNVDLLIIDKPHTLKIAEGANRGTTTTFYNIASGLLPLEPWDGKPKMLALSKELEEKQQGFIVLASDQKTGQIVAAGQFKKN